MRRKIEKGLLFLFLVLIPTQLGRHFWPEWSQVLGIRVDYLSPTLYLLDIVWVGLLVLNVPKWFQAGPSWIVLRTSNGDWKRTIVLVLMVGLNVAVAENKWEVGYWWLRVGQWVWMVEYIGKNKEKVWQMLKTVIPIWLAVQGGLAVAQIARGGSLQGLFYWLGERRFSFVSLGVARLSVAGRSMIRAYGTFSHPNSLAGFLLVALAMWQKMKERKVWWWIANWAGIIGIILAGSRTVWLLGIILLIFGPSWIVPKGTSNGDWKRVGGVLLLIGLVLIILGVVSVNYRTGDFLGGWDDESWGKRWSLNVTAVEMIKDNPLLGVGLGNFMVKLPEYQRGNGFFWMQPVHNIFLLVLAELGFVGSWLVWRKIRPQLTRLKPVNGDWKQIVWLIILITGMADHYWVTLPQNRWLLAVVVGLTPVGYLRIQRGLNTGRN